MFAKITHALRTKMPPSIVKYQRLALDQLCGFAESPGSLNQVEILSAGYRIRFDDVESAVLHLTSTCTAGLRSGKRGRGISHGEGDCAEEQ